MRLLSIALVVLALSPSLAKAVPVFNVSSVNCSGTLTSSFASVVSLGCAGSLSLDGGLLGGMLSADQQVILTADTISLANLYISAPVVTMSATNWINIGAGTTINMTNQFSMNAGTNSSYTVSAPTAGSVTLYAGSNIISRLNAGSITAPAPIAGSVLSTSRAGSITLPDPNAGTLTLSGLTNLSVPSFTTPTPITILSPVPEPSIFATMLAGLLALAGLAMVKRKQFSAHFV